MQSLSCIFLYKQFLNGLLMKRLFLASFFSLALVSALAQQGYVDSLHHEINDSKEDTTKVLVLNLFASYSGFNQFDSSIIFAYKKIDLS